MQSAFCELQASECPLVGDASWDPRLFSAGALVEDSRPFSMHVESTHIWQAICSWAA